MSIFVNCCPFYIEYSKEFPEKNINADSSTSYVVEKNCKPIWNKSKSSIKSKTAAKTPKLFPTVKVKLHHDIY